MNYHLPDGGKAAINPNKNFINIELVFPKKQNRRHPHSLKTTSPNGAASAEFWQFREAYICSIRMTCRLRSFSLGQTI